MIAKSAVQTFRTRRKSLILLIFLLSDNHVPTTMELDYALRDETEIGNYIIGKLLTYLQT